MTDTRTEYTPEVVEVTQADRDLLNDISDWLFKLTEGKVRIVATDDTFAPLKMIAAHRLAAMPAAVADVTEDVIILIPVIGPSRLAMWETNHTGGQFADPNVALSAALITRARQIGGEG